MEAKVDGKNAVANGRAEIDTQPPFRSVKDAVSLFGKGIVCGQVDPRKLRQTNSGEGSGQESMTVKQLEDTRHGLEKTREETELMATQMSSLKQELEDTKRELQQLKGLQDSKMVHVDDLGLKEELKFVKESPKQEEDEEEEEEEEEGQELEAEFEKKKRGKPSVTFKHPTLSQIVAPLEDLGKPSPESIERNPSIKKKNKNKMVPIDLWEKMEMRFFKDLPKPEDDHHEEEEDGKMSKNKKQPTQPQKNKKKAPALFRQLIGGIINKRKTKCDV